MTAWQRLYAATRELVTSAPIKYRLTEAFCCHLIHVDAAELPVPVRPALLDLLRELQVATPLHGESAARATIRKLSDRDAQRYAERIVELWAAADARQAYDATLRRRQQAAEALGLRASDTNVVPLLLRAEPERTPFSRA